MLVVFGTASLVVCALLIVIGRAIFVNPTHSLVVRRFATSAAYHVFLATVAGTGVVLLLLFVTGSTGLGVLEIAVTGGIAVAGILGIRFIVRAAGLSEHETAV